MRRPVVGVAPGHGDAACGDQQRERVGDRHRSHVLGVEDRPGHGDVGELPGQQLDGVADGDPAEPGPPTVGCDDLQSGLPLAQPAACRPASPAVRKAQTGSTVNSGATTSATTGG